MARLLLPSPRNERSALFLKVFAKHVSDGAGSILIPFFAVNEIDIDAVDTANTAANNAYNSFQKMEKDSESMFNDFINDFDKIVADHKGCVQAAKPYFFSNTKRLGDFGVTIHRNRIVYAKDRKTLCEDIMKFINHNASLPVAERPITAAYEANNKIDLAANLAALPGIMDAIDDYNQMVKDKETEHAIFVVEDKIVAKFLRITGQYIIKQFPMNPKTATLWGYTVVDALIGPVKTVAKFKKGEKKRLYGVRVGSKLKNTGASIQEITKRKAGTGVPIIINPGETWKVVRGYGIMTATSRGILLTGAITYFRNR